MRGYKKRKRGITINFIIIRKNVHIVQRAEGGGQINRNVGANSNQGGQTAVRGRTANEFSQFANGNGRSGIAGKKNDEQGGQSAIKINNKTKKKKSGRRR